MQAKSESNLWGIDASQWQGLIDWPKVAAAGVQFAFVKATDGVGWLDPQFRRNAGGANAVGIPASFYHYAHPETNSAAAEAEAFVEAVRGLPVDLPYVLDLEGNAASLGREALCIWADAWLQEVQRRTGRRVMIYTGASFALDYCGELLGKYPLWVAHYGTEQPMANGTWDCWSVFQYSDGGSCPGIAGRVDMNLMEVDFFNEIMAPPADEPKEDTDNMPMKLEEWQWDMLYEVMGKAYNVDQLEWDWMQKIVDRALTAAELAFLNTVLDGRIDRNIEA